MKNAEMLQNNDYLHTCMELHSKQNKFNSLVLQWSTLSLLQVYDLLP